MTFQNVFSDWLTDSVDVESLSGIGFDGAQTGSVVTVSNVMVDDESRLVRNNDGNEVVSSTTVYVALDDADAFTLHSKVTLPSGRVTTVIKVATYDVNGLFQMAAVNCE